MANTGFMPSYDNHQAEKENVGEIEKYSQKNVRVVYNSFFFVCV